MSYEIAREPTPGFDIELTGRAHDASDYPTLLMYVVGGIHRYGNSGNGYADTAEYFEFTTTNGALTAPVHVTADKTSYLVLTLEPRGDVGCSALAASVAHTTIAP